MPAVRLPIQFGPASEAGWPVPTPPLNLTREVAEARIAQRCWARQTIAERLRLVRNLRHALVDNTDRLIRAAAAESDRPKSEILASQILPLADACRFLEKRASSLLAPRRLGRRGQPIWLAGNRSEIRREPHGLVLILGASNYPLFLPTVQTLQALVAGNAVFLKPGAGGTPAARLFGELFHHAGLNSRLLQVLPEATEAARSAVIAGVDKVVLTGSAETGAALLASLAPRLVPATLELSGSDPMLVREDADLDLVTRAILFGLRLNGSATCIAPRRIIVARRVAEQLEARLQQAIEELPSIPCTGRLGQKLSALLKSALAAGGTLLSGSLNGDNSVTGPVILSGARPDWPLLQEDLFAPVCSLVIVDSDAEAIAAAAQCPYALGATIFSRDLAQARNLAGVIRAGVVSINDLIAPTADPRLPFGGRGRSGFGVTRGAEGLLEMTVPKVVSIHRGSFYPHFEAPSALDADLLLQYLGAAHGKSIRSRVTSAVRFLTSLVRRIKS